MDSNQSQDTEYKRAFEWRRPMVEVPPPKPEPMISQYQISYGSGAQQHNAATTKLAAPDQVDRSISHSSTESRSPTPGGLVGFAIKDSEVHVQVFQEQEAPLPPVKINNNHHHPEQIGHGPAVLFDYEPPPRPPSPVDLTKQSEYHAKFKPFDDYVYVEGEGKFKKQTPATKLVASSAGTNASASKAWFVEVEERYKQSCKYRARSQNGKLFHQEKDS